MKFSLGYHIFALTCKLMDYCVRGDVLGQARITWRTDRAMTTESESDHFSPYRLDGKLYGFVCVVTGANQLVGGAIAVELAVT